MKFKKQSIKELLDNGASLIIDDELTPIELQELVKIAKKYNVDKDNTNKRHITILARNKGLEDLKRIASAGNGCVTIDVSGR